MGSRYQHLSNDSSTLLVDWEGHEQDLFMADPSVGVNEYLTDEYTSLFLRDVTNGTQITAFSSIAGYTDCLGKVPPKVVGYYMGRCKTAACFFKVSANSDRIPVPPREGVYHGTRTQLILPHLPSVSFRAHYLF